VADAIQRIVEAVSDGERIDWEAARRRLSDRAALASCAHLELLSKIGRLAEQRDESETGDVGESLAVSLLIGIALLQILLGLVGAIAYRPYSLINALRVLTVLSFAGVGIVLRLTPHNPRARDLGAVFLLSALGFSERPYRMVFDAWFGNSLARDVFRSGLAVNSWAPYFIWQFARRFPATTRFTTIDRTAIAFSRARRPAYCFAMRARFLFFSTELFLAIT